MVDMKEVTVNRTYKARIFAMIFSDKKELLALYNAVNDTDYDDPELLEINTLENAIYMSMRNDVSFILDSRLSLYEHQSTYSPNLPLRYLFYVSDLYAGMIHKKSLYRKTAVRIPAPRFLIFYNGKDEYPEKQVLKLSDLYTVSEEEAALELKAVMLNINPGCNQTLLNACKTLKDYAEYTARVRRYVEIMSLEDAVERAINECISEGILAEFLSKNKAEAKKMSIYEYDEEETMRQLREESYEEGEAAERQRALRLLIKTLWGVGVTKEEIISRVCENYPLSENEVMEMIDDCIDTTSSLYVYHHKEETMCQLREESYEEGYGEGEAAERKRNISLLIKTLIEYDIPREEIMKKVEEKYLISSKEIEELIDENMNM